MSQRANIVNVYRGKVPTRARHSSGGLFELGARVRQCFIRIDYEYEWYFV